MAENKYQLSLESLQQILATFINEHQSILTNATVEPIGLLQTDEKKRNQGWSYLNGIRLQLSDDISMEKKEQFLMELDKLWMQIITLVTGYSEALKTKLFSRIEMQDEKQLKGSIQLGFQKGDKPSEMLLKYLKNTLDENIQRNAEPPQPT